MVLLLLAAAAAGVAVATWVSRVVDETPPISALHQRPQGAVSTVYAGDGTRLGFITGDTLRQQIHGRDVPTAMREATVAIEDRRFYQHGGVDYVGIARAAVKDLTSNETVQGGSTLTMQLVRNLYLPHTRYEKTIERKVREAKLADELEQVHTKEWILNTYLDNVPYGTVGGQTAVGVQAAARTFFDVPASKLTLPQAALLAGLPQAPTDYNPFLHPQRARARRYEVLAAMVKSGDITADRAARAADTPLGVRPSTFYQQRREHFFFDYVRSVLLRKYGRTALQRGGLRVYTTIDPHLQELARTSIADHLNQPGQPSSALVTVDPRNGHIRAMASSAEYGPTVFNYATQAFRQPGSTFKAIDLMAAVRMGVSPDATYYDSHELQPGWNSIDPTWSVQTDDHVYHGAISLSEAIALSDNTVYAQLGADIGPEAVRQAAYDMGVTSHLDAYPAESIGGLTHGVSALEMADAYATIADGGWRNTVTGIAQVVHPDGRVDNLGAPRRRQEFTDGQAAAVTTALKGVIDHGTGAGLSIGCPAAGKTGTTSSFTDAWFVGFTPELSTAVWVGYPDETSSMDAVPGYGEVFGATIPGPIWQQYMQSAIGSACDDFPPPRTPFAAQPFDGQHQVSAGSPSEDETSSDETTDGDAG